MRAIETGTLDSVLRQQLSISKVQSQELTLFKPCYDSYLRFDLSSVGSIAAARFRISASLSSGSIGMSVYAVSNTTWSETAITWNNKPARGGALGTVTVSGSAFTYYEFDVSSYVIGEKAAGRNLVSLALHNPASSSQSIWMPWRENTSGMPPQLVITLNEAPTVSLTSPANGATFTAPATITLTATAADSDGTIQKVEFFHGGTNLIATVTSAPYTFNWTNVAAASYSLTAKVTDNLNAVTTSDPVNITVNTSVAQMYFIHADHLNTPRVITNNAGQAVWRWDQSDPFGGNTPDENPNGLGIFSFNLRFPGQYFDRELNTHYNYYRDYDPSIGRYVESDPIGLRGGVNTYAYVYSDPLRLADPEGLEVRLICRPVDGPVGVLFDHCFVHVSCPQEGWQQTLSLLGSYPYLSATGYKVKGFPNVKDPTNPDHPASPANTYREAIVPSVNASPCGCDYEKTVVNRFNSAPPTLPYYGLAFNSNTFAAYLITSTQYGTQVPANAPTAAIGLR